MDHAIEQQLCPMRRNTLGTPQGLVEGPASAGRATPPASWRGDPLPSDPGERVLVLVLRCLAAAGETGDAVCWDEALDRAAQVFGPRDGALVVARAAALHRSLAQSDGAPEFLPLPCRRLSRGESELLQMIRASVGSQDHVDAEAASPASRLSPATRSALADVADAVRTSRSAVLGLRPAA